MVTADGNSGPRPGCKTPVQMHLMQAGTLPGALLPAPESASAWEAVPVPVRQTSSSVFIHQTLSTSPRLCPGLDAGNTAETNTSPPPRPSPLALFPQD